MNADLSLIAALTQCFEKDEMIDGFHFRTVPFVDAATARERFETWRREIIRWARRLRMLGFDTLWFNDLGDSELARIAASEHRILLTRDRALLMHRAVTHGHLVPAGGTDEQLAELVRRLQLCGGIAPFNRCTVCNGSIEPVSAKKIAAEIPEGVKKRFEEFRRCAGCGRVYWKGGHWETMRRWIDALCG